jgi:hypothetical protein
VLDPTVDLIQSISAIGHAPDQPSAVRLLRAITQRLGLDAAVFTSYVQEDATASSCRALLACDPAWALQYAEHAWCRHDPWLRHALGSAEPVLARDLVPLSEQERWVADAAAHYGFRSALIVPAPTPAALSRTGVLCLGSQRPDFFDRDGAAELTVLGVLARSLAMQLGDWMHRVVRDELMASARISADDLRLLQHQRQGHNSKRIAAMLGTEAKTIDCRFQRLNLRLGAANRRAAVRLAELYGLI